MSEESGRIFDATELDAYRMPRHLIVRSTVRQFALDYAATTKRLFSGQPRFTRVSEEWIARREAKLMADIRADIDRLPANGRTIV